MKRFILLFLLLSGFYGIAQQHVDKIHYKIINPNSEPSLNYEKALTQMQLDEFRFMNGRRQISIEGTSIKVELFSAQELLINYGKAISPLTIKNPINATDVSFKLAKDKHALLTLPSLPVNKFANIQSTSSAQKITNFGSMLYDSGELTGAYSNNETYIKTIYSDNGEKPYLNFTSFSTETNFDVMYIYDGADASAKLIGAYTGGNSPKIVQASGAYLTIVFTSDGSNTSAGWAASVERGTPPPPPSPMSAPTCQTADPFCTGTTYNFPATVGGTAGQAGPNYGCLGSQPNPAWYYLQIANSGNLVLNIAGSGGYDVDFICWGPFTSPTAPCTAALTSASIVDCSYSTSATETDHIPNAVTGQFYMVLITNFANVAQNIIFNQTGGTGSTNCSIVAPCSVTATNTGPYCIGQTIGVVATSTATGTYSWTGPSAYSASGATPTRGGATAAMSGTYSVVLTSGSGTCTATTAVTVSASPTISATSAAICLGNSASLTSSGATNYTWTTGGVTVSTTSGLTASPATTTAYNVVGAIGTCTASTVATITVNPKPTVTATSGTICIGGTTTLTASGASTYSWSPTTGLTPATGVGPSVVASPAATTTYVVTGANASGCTNTVSVVVTVNPKPTITVPSATICAGNSTSLTASGASSYTWSPIATVSPSTGITVTANPTSTQIYTIMGTSAAGCTNSVTTVVTVSPLPTVTVNNPTICTGGTAVITASGASSYVWTPGGSVSASISVTPVSTQIYQVVGTTSSCTATATSTVTVVSNPVITANSDTICLGGTAALTASGGNTYTWSPSASLNSPTGTTVNASPTITTTYSILATVGTCTASGTTTVTVNPLPTITATSGTICTGQQTTLTASGGSTYVWSPAASLSPSATSNPVTANPTTTQIYVVTGTDANGCVNTATTTVTVNPLPTITATSGTICIGQQTATLTASGGTSYVWSAGATAISVTSATATPGATQNYVVTGTDANGCVNSYTTSVTVNPLPTITASSATVCSGFPGTITASGGTGTYTWTTTTPVSHSPSITESPISTTNYNVIGVDGNGCTNTAVGTIAVYSAFAISVNSATICAAGQQTATLTATGAATYTWTPATGLSSNTGSVVTTTPVATTTVYTVVGTSAVGGCAAVTTASLTVNALPQPVAISNTPCANQQALTFSCTPAGLANYDWTGPNSYHDTGANPSVPISGVTTSLSGIYTVVVTDNNTPACTNTTVVNVIVNPLPIATASVAPVCLGATINLMATGGVGYSWSHQGEAAYTSSSQNPTRPTSTFTMAGTYIVTVTDANNCVSAAFATAVVNPLPVVMAASNNICVGQQTATLTASGAVTYTWSGSNLASTDGTPVNANPTFTSIYNVVGTDANSCVGTATTVVTVNALPVVGINNVTPDCIPLFAPFTATSSPQATSYNWNFGNGQTSTLASPSTTYTTAGTSLVTLTLTDINNCVNTATTNVTGFAIPIAAFDYGTKPVTVLAPEVQFYNQSTPGLNYNWNFGDIYNNTDSITNPNHVYTNPGTYTVTLIVSSSNGCKATIEGEVIIEDDYVIYVPNAFSPNADGTNEIFKPVGEGIATYKLFIFDRWGSLIFYSEDIDKGWDGTYQTKGGNVVQQDVYVWKIQLKNVLNVSKDLTGTVTLLK